MKLFFRLTALATSALGLLACDQKPAPIASTPALPPPAVVVPGAPAVKADDPAVNSFMEEYQAFSQRLSQAVEKGEREQIQPLLAKAGALAVKGKEYAAKLLPEDQAAFEKKLAEYAKPVQAAAQKLAAGAVDRLKALKEMSKDRLESMKHFVHDATAPEPAPATPEAPTPDR